MYMVFCKLNCRCSLHAHMPVAPSGVMRVVIGPRIWIEKRSSNLLRMYRCVEKASIRGTVRQSTHVMPWTRPHRPGCEALSSAIEGGTRRHYELCLARSRREEPQVHLGSTGMSKASDGSDRKPHAGARPPRQTGHIVEAPRIIEQGRALLLPLYDRSGAVA